MITRIVMEYDAPCFNPIPGAEMQPVIGSIRTKVSEGVFPEIAGQKFPARVEVSLINDDSAAARSAFERILVDIADERYRQDALWGPDHDDRHTPVEWINLVAGYIDRANMAATPYSPTDMPASVSYLRHLVVRIAALAVAWVESIDRKEAARAI